MFVGWISAVVMSSHSFFLKIFGRMGCGAVVVEGTSNIISFNDVAHDIISDLLEKKPLSNIDFREGFKKLIASGDTRFRIDSESWIVVSRADKQPLAIYSTPMSDGKDSYHTSMIIIVDVNRASGPSIEVLQRMFGLTPAECNICLQISEGKTLQEIAEVKGISTWTVRTQLAKILPKTGVRRQSDLVSLLLKIRALP